jgi:hypothetical protein
VPRLSTLLVLPPRSRPRSDGPAPPKNANAEEPSARTGKKTPGGAGTHTGHTGHADAQRHSGHTDEPHNHPNPPTTHTPHVSATTEAAADSTAAGPEPTAPRGRLRRGHPQQTRPCVPVSLAGLSVSSMRRDSGRGCSESSCHSRSGSSCAPAPFSGHRRLRERLRTAYALLFGPGGIDAARAYAEEHDLEVSEPRLEPVAIARRDTELRRIAALVAAGAHVQLACTRACRDACHGAVICQQVVLRARAVSPEEAAVAAEAMAAAPAQEQPLPMLTRCSPSEHR